MITFKHIIFLLMFSQCVVTAPHDNYMLTYYEAEDEIISGTQDVDSTILVDTNNDGKNDTSPVDTSNGENIDMSYDDAYTEIYDMLGIDSMLNSIRHVMGNDINPGELLDAVKDGNLSKAGKLAVKYIGNNLSKELVSNKALMIELVSIVLLGSIFVNLSVSFGNSFVSENGFYVTYLIMTSLMLVSFQIALDMVSDSIERVLVLIRILVPVYAMSMNFVGHTNSSIGMYEVILAGVWLVQVVILRFILPMIKFYVIVYLINNLNREDNFSKMCELINKLVKWMLKTIVVFIAGLNLIKSLIEPQIDALGRNTISRVMSSIPGGGIMSVLTGTFLGSGLVIKNCIGVAGIIFIGLIVMVPIVKAFLLMVSVKLTGAIIQPVGEKRYVNSMESLSHGVNLLVQALLSSVVLFVLTIAVMAYSSNGG